MKKSIVILAVLFALSAPAYAQMGMMGAPETGGGMMGQGMGGMTNAPGADGGMMGSEMMRMMMPMMKQMMGQGMMMQDMMRMMQDMANMQKRMMKDAKPAEKKEMMAEMDGMMKGMDKMMSGMRGMMAEQTTADVLGGLACAEQWLKEAIDLHDVHLKDPKTATEASQVEMMDQMENAYACVKRARGAGAGNSHEGVQEKSEAGVTAKVSLEGENGGIKFKVVLETHSADLDVYRFEDIAVLRADGKEYGAKVLSQEGSGHHRSAVVEFVAPKKGAAVEIVIKNVAGVKERVFKFQK